MGALCCSPCGDGLEVAFSGNVMHRQCGCVRCFFHQLFPGYNGMFYRLEGRPASTQLQGTFSSPSSSLSDHRYTRLQRDGLIFRRDKSMTNLRETSQPLRRNKSSSSVESLGHGKNWNVGDHEEEAVRASSALKLPQRVMFMRPSSSEDEDVCPTCLEEYTPEDPKIVTQCSHHFHLGCIYEWLERSDLCPICGKEMEFREDP